MDLERASDPASQGLCLTRLLPSPTLQEAGSRQKEGRTAGSCWPRLFLPLRKGKPILEAASRNLLLHSMGQNGVLWLPSYKGEGTVSCGLCSGRQRGGRGWDRAPGGPSTVSASGPALDFQEEGHGTQSLTQPYV